MGIVFCEPVEVFAARLLPATIGAETCFTTDKVVPRNHATGDGFVHPHLRLFSGLMDVAPARVAGGIRSGYVGGGVAVHDCVADSSLQCASPDGGFVSAATLVVAVVPVGNTLKGLHVRSADNRSAHIRKEQVVRTLLLGDAVPHLPQIQDPLSEPVPVGGRV